MTKFSLCLSFSFSLCVICRASCPDPHTQGFLWASLAPHWAVSLSLCKSWARMSAWLCSLNSCFSFQHTDLGSCTDVFSVAVKQTQHRQTSCYKGEETADLSSWVFKVVSFQPDCCHCDTVCVLCHLEKDFPLLTCRQRSMVRKIRRASGIPMVLPKSCESEDVLMVFMSAFGTCVFFSFYKKSWHCICCAC